jgi:hypothetical protein
MPRFSEKQMGGSQRNDITLDGSEGIAKFAFLGRI